MAAQHAITILIPVFNSPHYVYDLFASLRLHSNPELVAEIIIGDDASDATTKKVIADFAQQQPFKITVMTQEKNIGYLHNANQLFNAAKTDIVVFLNTDTLVPAGWLERLQKPFLTDSKIALATPFSTNATYLTVLPNEGQTWQDIDRGLQTFAAKYPDAHMAVGFCLAVRKNLLQGEALFDNAYQFGYWEETDLHYRMLDKGYRSVVIDNLLVYHAKGSSSFSTTLDLQIISGHNKKIFDRRWGEVHAQKEKAYKSALPYDYMRYGYRFCYFQTNQQLDVLFVLPAMIDKSGGIKVVIKMVEWLNLQGLRASIYTYGFIDQTYVDFVATINPWRSLSALKESITNIKLICATSYDSVNMCREIADYYDAKLSYLVQGPETLFDEGTSFATTARDYNEIEHIYCVSTFLVNFLRTLEVSNPVLLPLGPEVYQFYPMPKKVRKQKTIAACLRLGYSKATSITLYCLQLAKQAGFEIHLFGKDSRCFTLPLDFAEQHGDLSPGGLRDLFSTVEYYLDLSYFEGLGLLPLEAANCGAIPILNHNGGSEFIFTHNQNAFFLTSPFITQDFFKDLINRDQQEIVKIRTAALSVCANLGLSLYAAREKFTQHLQTMLANISSAETADNKQQIVWKKLLSSVTQQQQQSRLRVWLSHLLRKLWLRYKADLEKIVTKIALRSNAEVISRLDHIQKELELQKAAVKKLLNK